MKITRQMRRAGQLALLGLLVTVPALAQQAKGPAAVVSFKKQSQLSAQEQIAQAKKYVAEMRVSVKAVAAMANRARKDKDIIKLNCVNDKLLQINGNLRLAEQLMGKLRAAAARRNEGARSHEFSKLTIAHQKVVVLNQEAEACIGEEIAYLGQSTVRVEVDQNIRKDDPTTAQPDPAPVTRPPVASPAGT